MQLASRMPIRAALKAQRGASMPVALMLLLVMSLIAVTSLNTTMLEEKMAVNTQHQINVFQGAESLSYITSNKRLFGSLDNSEELIHCDDNATVAGPTL